MGKCKQRSILRAKKSNFDFSYTRQEALKIVIKEIEKDPTSFYAISLISLFGLTAEELSESGITYEVLRSLDLVLA